MVIFSGEMPEADFEKESGEFRRSLQESTKGISHEEAWGRKKLAYRIKKQAYGYYVIFNFASAPSAISELRTNVKLNPCVLRHLLITVPEDYVPGRYKDEVLPEAKPEEEMRRARKMAKMLEAKPAVSSRLPEAAAEKEPVTQEAAAETAPKPTLSGKAEEDAQLKRVEKKLEEILENPDIDIR